MLETHHRDGELFLVVVIHHYRAGLHVLHVHSSRHFEVHTGVLLRQLVYVEVDLAAVHLVTLDVLVLLEEFLEVNLIWDVTRNEVHLNDHHVGDAVRKAVRGTGRDALCDAQAVGHCVGVDSEVKGITWLGVGNVVTEDALRGARQGAMECDVDS